MKEKEIEFKIKGLMMDPLTNSPIVVLQQASSDTLLPIWVGIFEANAIALQIEKVDTPRPMTHDLIKGLLNHLNVTVTKIVVTELKENTFYALSMSLASLYGGLALANAGLGAVHGFAGPIGGMFPAPHGAVCAALLPPVMEANLQALRVAQSG